MISGCILGNRNVAISMIWHVQYGADTVVRFQTPEAAIEAACQLIDCGHEVTGLGMGDITDSISKVEIAKIYAIWARASASRRRGLIRRRAISTSRNFHHHWRFQCGNLISPVRDPIGMSPRRWRSPTRREFSSSKMKS
jgi:hypothetical protein